MYPRTSLLRKASAGNSLQVNVKKRRLIFKYALVYYYSYSWLCHVIDILIIVSLSQALSILEVVLFTDLQVYTITFRKYSKIPIIRGILVKSRLWSSVLGTSKTILENKMYTCCADLGSISANCYKLNKLLLWELISCRFPRIIIIFDVRVVLRTAGCLKSKNKPAICVWSVLVFEIIGVEICFKNSTFFQCRYNLKKFSLKCRNFKLKNTYAYVLHIFVTITNKPLFSQPRGVLRKSQLYRIS